MLFLVFMSQVKEAELIFRTVFVYDFRMFFLKFNTYLEIVFTKLSFAARMVFVMVVSVCVKIGI